MIGPVREATTVVWGKRSDLKVQQIGKSKFRAWGDFEGHSIDGEGRTAGAAISSWATKAKYSSGQE